MNTIRIVKWPEIATVIVRQRSALLHRLKLRNWSLLWFSGKLRRRSGKWQLVHWYYRNRKVRFNFSCTILGLISRWLVLRNDLYCEWMYSVRNETKKCAKYRAFYKIVSMIEKSSPLIWFLKADLMQISVSAHISSIQILNQSENNLRVSIFVVISSQCPL